MASSAIPTRISALGASLAVAALVAATGCSGRPGPVDVVAVDAVAGSQQLIAANDKNGDGVLSQDELAALGAVRERFDVYDADGNGQIAQAELAENLARVFDGRTGLLSASCRVTRNGQPLVGAYVYFIPIALIADSVPIASGVTEHGGVAKLSIQKEDLPKNAPPVSGLIRPGLYSVEIVHPTLKVPEIYNKQTTLGQEVTPETCAGGPLQVALKF